MAFNKKGQGGGGDQSSRTIASGVGQDSNPQQQHDRMSGAASAAARASVMHGQQQAGGVGDGYSGQQQHQHQQQQPEKRRQMGDGGGGGSVLLYSLSGLGSALHPPTGSSTSGQPLTQWFNFDYCFTGGFSNNDGVSCYANSDVTALLSLPSFVEYLHSCIGRSEAEPLIGEMLRLQNCFDAGNGSLTHLRSMVRSSYGCQWTRTEGQQDSADFLGALIDTLIDEADDGGLELKNLFTMTLAQNDRCDSCKLVEIERPPADWNVTNVPLQGQHLEECFQSVLTGASFTKSCQCSSSPATFVPEIRIDKHPVCMVVQLMRFCGQLGSSQAAKMMQPVQVPLTWKPTHASPTYYLRAATLHHGNKPTSGHYTTLRLTPDGQAILVSDNTCTRISSMTEIQTILSQDGYCFYYDLKESTPSPETKRMKATHHPTSPPPVEPAFVERAKRNILSAAGDSLPKHQPPPTVPLNIAIVASTDDSSSSNPPQAATSDKDKFIQELVTGKRHTQFKKMDQKSCEHYLGLLNVTPFANCGEKAVRSQLHRCITEEILAEVGRDLNKCNKILHHLGIGKLKALPVSATPVVAAATSTSGPTGETTAVPTVANAAATAEPAGEGTRSTHEDLQQAPTQINPSTDEIKAIIGPIRVLLAKENNHETLTAAERVQRSDLITLLVLNCPSVALLKKFLLDQNDGKNKPPKPQNSVTRLRDDVAKYVSGNRRGLCALIETIVQYKELMETLDQLLAKATTTNLVCFLEALPNVKITNRSTKRIKDLVCKEVRDKPSTIEQLRAIVDDQPTQGSSSGSSLISPAVSTDIDNASLARNVLQFDQLDAETTKQLAVQLKCKKNQLKKRLIKRLVDQTNPARLKQVLRKGGHSPQKRHEAMKKQTVSIGMKNPSLLQKIVSTFEEFVQQQQKAYTSNSATTTSDATSPPPPASPPVSHNSAVDGSLGEGSTSSNNPPPSSPQNDGYGLTSGQACRILLTGSPMASQTVDQLELLTRLIFQESATQSPSTARSATQYHAQLCKRINTGLAHIIVNDLSIDHKIYLMRMFRKKCVRDPEKLTENLINLVKINRIALMKAVHLVSGGTDNDDDDDDDVVPGPLGHDYHPDNLDDVQASQEVMEYIRLARMEGLRSNQFSITPPSWPEDNPILLAGEQWSNTMSSLQLRTCSECLEKWIHPISPCAQKCPRCANDRSQPSTYSPANGMFPGIQPPALRHLTLVEQLCIAQICPMMSVVLHPNQSTTLQGQVVSFYQGGNTSQTVETTVLPRRPDNLGLCLIKQGNGAQPQSQCRLTASRQRIREALLWLKANNRFYANVTISEEALQLYPVAGGAVNNLMQLTEFPADNNNDGQHQQPTAAVDQNQPQPEESYQSSMTMSKMDVPTIEQQLQEAVRLSSTNNDGSAATPPAAAASQNATDPTNPEGAVSWRHQLDRESEEGFFTRCFPYLFPTAAGDVTLPRLGKSPKSLLDWAAHLTRLELGENEPNPFASDMRFAHTVTNIHLRQECLKIGNVYTNRTLGPDMTVRDLKDRIEAKDPQIIGNLMLFGAQIPGSRPFWSYQERKLVALEKMVEHYSDGDEGFNIFITFSLPDLHLRELHRLLPGSSVYLDKIVVQSEADIPAGADPANYITKKMDYALRLAAISNNTPLVTEFAQRRIQELFKTVLSCEMGLTDYVCRTEFGSHGRAPHFHIVANCQTIMRPQDFQEACRSIFSVEDCGLDGPELEDAKQAAVKAGHVVVEPGEEVPEAIVHARERVGRACVATMGISEIHPVNTENHQPASVIHHHNNVLRTQFSLDANLEEDYCQLIDKLQVHTCRPNTCRQGLSHQQAKCRAGFPLKLAGYQVNETTHQLERQKDNYLDGYEFGSNNNQNSSIQGGPLQLLRNHPYVVAHNPELLLLWRGNINVQAVSSKWQLYEYINKDCMREESKSLTLRQLMTNFTKQTEGLTDPEQLLQQLFATCSEEHDFSKMECLHLINGHPYVKYSRSHVAVNLSETRQVRLESWQGSERASRDNHFDVYINRQQDANYLGLVEKYESGSLRLPKDPKLLSLYEFCAEYSLKWQYHGQLRAPLTTPLYRYVPPMYGPTDEGNRRGLNPRHLDYCRTHLLLFKPGATPDNLLEAGHHQNYHEALLSFAEDEDSHCPKWLRKDFLDFVRLSHQEQQEQQQADEGDDDNNAVINDLTATLTAATENAADPTTDSSSTRDQCRELLETLGVDIEALLRSLKQFQKAESGHQQPQQVQLSTLTIDPSSLNARQRVAFDHIILSLERGHVHLYDLNGKAGSGKTYFIRCLQHVINSRMGEGCCRIAAPTGSAACQFVGGQTLHCLLKLNLDDELRTLTAREVKELEAELKHLKLLIIDEKSMVGLKMLHRIDQRLRQIFSATKKFGGISILLAGDICQLPCIGDTPLYNKDSTHDCEVNQGRLLYKDFDQHTFVFQEQMRQTGPAAQFYQQLLRLAEGSLTEEDWRMWCQQSYHSMDPERKASFNDAILLAARKAHLANHNLTQMASLGTPLHRIQAINMPPSAAYQSADQANGLGNTLNLAVGGRVILTQNLWVTHALVNGSLGTIRNIVYRQGNTSQLPDTILVRFDGYTGPSCVAFEDRVVALRPKTAHWSDKNSRVFLRTMYPLAPAYGLTIHKAQGMTLGKVKIDLCSGETSSSNSLVFTGLSRVRRLEDLAFWPRIPDFDFFQSNGSSKAAQELKKMEEERKLQLANQLLDQLQDELPEATDRNA